MLRAARRAEHIRAALTNACRSRPHLRQTLRSNSTSIRSYSEKYAPHVRSYSPVDASVRVRRERESTTYSITARMLLELWRWKPRLVWLVMHAATLGLLWCARAWPSQPHFGALLATTAALYASVSFVDPGYVELASASAATPDRASLSALTVPLVLQACTPCTYDASADAMADQMHMPCAHAMHTATPMPTHMRMPCCRRARCAWSTSRRARSTATTAAGP